jgi:short-subunit dehydrogenase
MPGVGVSGPFADSDLREQLNLIELNVISPVHLTRRVIQDMLARRAGRILFTSSIAATMPGPFEATYNASKAFLKSFAEGIRSEIKDSGVTVTTLMPGATETNFFHRAGADDTKLGTSEKDDPAEVARDGFEALMAGKDHVVAGSFKNKVQATMSHILPDTVPRRYIANKPSLDRRINSASRIPAGTRRVDLFRYPGMALAEESIEDSP